VVSWDEFETVVVSKIRDISYENNDTQNEAISAPIDESLYLVAGPGSGKTTVIALRVLKLVFVDEVDPSNIMVTTFTKKAASELISRIIRWGEILSEEFEGRFTKTINFNLIIIGTLDSIIEEILSDYRDPGSPKPIVIENFVSKALSIQFLWEHGRFQNEDLINYLSMLNGLNFTNVPEINKMILEIKDRSFHDLIDMDSLKCCGDKGAEIVCDCIKEYNEDLEEKLLFDFSRLEYAFFEKIQANNISFFENLQFILIDEYQDTNLLQEQIYFKLAEYPLKNGGSISVVGDDDQALYRFRGATVELFHDFQNRVKNQINIDIEPKYLSKNYRSTDAIIDFYNQFIMLDNDYQDARVERKPLIGKSRNKPFINFPVLGMFRDTVEELSNDLSRFLDDVINNDGFSFFDENEEEFTIKLHPSGSPGDIALLCSSPKETGFNNNKRLPYLLREDLKNLSSQVDVFNPRGQSLEKIKEIQELCGLILECIDPTEKIQDEKISSKKAKEIFNEWRQAAKALIHEKPTPEDPTLEEFVSAWQNRTPLFKTEWSKEVDLIDLVYTLITWIPYLQDDLEGLVSLEAVVRAISQAAIFSYSKSKITFDDEHPNYEINSIHQILKDIFVPIALGSIDIEESLLEETLPTNRLNIMSIHQAKGLEFPLVIVDVGCDFKNEHWNNSHKRFPRYKSGTNQVLKGRSVNIEDTFNDYSPIAPNSRSNLDRAFDDLIRQYFVAFSRTQDVLLLIGINSVKDGYEKNGKIKVIPNIATGWDRNNNWHWGEGLNNIIHI
jgi:DNA helicase II / ATP-dependent DNA helicase PcrA